MSSDGLIDQTVNRLLDEHRRQKERQTMTYTGKMRVHFNRHGAAPLVWCIATDEWELAISTFTVRAPLQSVYRPKETPDNEDGKPSAWLEVTGTMTVRNSHAEIVP